MDNHEFEDLGKKIQDIVDNAVNSNSYHELSHTINQTVNKAIDSGSEALKNAMNSVFEPGSDPQFRKRSYTYQSPYYGKSKKAKQQAAKKQTELLYGKTTGENLKGMMMAVSGGILLSGGPWCDVCRRCRGWCASGSRNQPPWKTGPFSEIYPCAGRPHLL